MLNYGMTPNRVIRCILVKWAISIDKPQSLLSKVY